MHHEPLTVGMKTCKSCGEAKHVLAFSVVSGNADGMNVDCRDCVSRAHKHKYPNHGRGKKAAIARMRLETWGGD